MPGTIPSDPKMQARIDTLAKVLQDRIRLIDDDNAVSLPALLRLFSVSAITHCISLTQGGGMTWADVKKGLMEDVDEALNEVIVRMEFVLKTAAPANDEDDNDG